MIGPTIFAGKVLNHLAVFPELTEDQIKNTRVEVTLDSEELALLMCGAQILHAFMAEDSRMEQDLTDKAKELSDRIAELGIDAVMRALERVRSES